MDLFKLKKWTRGRKPILGGDSEDKAATQPEADNNVGKSLDVDNNTTNVEAEEDDDDFITNEVKRRLKELRRNSFMALIPEEDSSPEDDEDGGETSSSEWREVEAAEARYQFWPGFDAFYDRYCERMLFFDRFSAQQLQEAAAANNGGSHVLSTPSPRSPSKKLTSPFRCLSLKKIKEPEDEMEHLQQPGSDPYQDLETAYVAQLCLTWETLHCQYTQLSQKISCQPENLTSYNHSAQQFQQFQVLLQRFVENEPYEQGVRPEVYARTRNSLPKLLHVPKIQGSDQKTSEEESDWVVLAPSLINIIECCILTFRQFLKMEKKKSGSVRNIFGNQNHMATPLQQVQSSLEKKYMKLKEQRKKSKRWRKNRWPSVHEDVELLLSIVDVNVVGRVLRMVSISKEQLFWCEEKMKKIDFLEGKLRRDPSSSPVLFPSC